MLSTATLKTRRFQITLLAISTGLIVLVLLFAWLALPHLLKWQAEKQVLEKSGHTLQLGLPSINPLTLTVSVPGMSLKTPDHHTLLAFNSLWMNVSAKDLLLGRITLDELELNGLDLQVVLLPKGQLNWSRLIEAFSSDEPKSPPPAFKLGRLRIHNSTLALHDQRTPDGFQTRLQPVNIELSQLSTRSRQAGEFLLDAHTEFGGALKLQAQITPDETPRVQGRVSIEQVDLAKLHDLLAPLLPVSPPQGLVQASTRFDVQLLKGQARFAIQDLKVQGSKLAVAAKSGPQSPTLELGNLGLHGGQFDSGTQEARVDAIQLDQLNMRHAAGRSAPNALVIDRLRLGKLAMNLKNQTVQLDVAAVEGGSTQLHRNKEGRLDFLDVLSAWSPPDNPNTTPRKPWSFAIGQARVQQFNTLLRDDALAPGFKLGLTDVSIKVDHITHNLDTPLPVQVSFKTSEGGQIELQGEMTPASGKTDANWRIEALPLQAAQPFLHQLAKLDIQSGLLSSQGKLKHTGGAVSSTGSFKLEKLQLNEAGTQQSFLKLKSLATPNFTASNAMLDIPRLNLSGLDTQLLIAKDRSTNIGTLLKKTEKSPADGSKKPTQATQKTSQPLVAKVGRLQIADSELDFADQSLMLPFGTRIHTLNGSITGFSSQAGSRARLELTGEVDDFGLAKAQGQLDLFNPTAYMDLLVQFKNVEMTRLTPYSATFANRKIDSGKLSLNLEYKIDKQQLDSSNQLIVDKLVLGERVQSPQAKDLPLDLAIALLEDADGRIDLGLPISGSLDDPQFSWGALVWKVVSNVLTKVVTSPFRALGALLGDDKEIGELTFDAGSSQFNPPQRQNLKQLAQALAQRPNLSLRLDGTWSEADRLAIQSQQFRRTVALQAGEALGPDETPGPIATETKQVQAALDALLKKRLDAEQQKAFRKEHSKDSAFYTLLVQRLEQTETVSSEQLVELARKRQQMAREGLLAQKAAPEQIQTGEIREIEAQDGEVKQGLTLGSLKAQQ